MESLSTVYFEVIPQRRSNHNKLIKEGLREGQSERVAK